MFIKENINCNYFFSYFSVTFATTNYLKEDKFKPI